MSWRSRLVTVLALLLTKDGPAPDSASYFGWKAVTPRCYARFLGVSRTGVSPRFYLKPVLLEEPEVSQRQTLALLALTVITTAAVALTGTTRTVIALVFTFTLV